MRIYRIDWQDPADGHRVAWAGSARDAARRLREARQQVAENYDENAEPSGFSAVEVPTDKAGLLSWLNAYFDSDNG
jgi:hypothetical protein